jgi:hypothetical protein
MRLFDTYGLMMFLFSLLACANFTVHGQEAQDVPENIFIHCNRYSCLAGDTIWWKGYVLQDNGFLKGSTNLYVEVFNDSGKMIDHVLFPVISGQAIGQIALPDSLPSGIYWLRFLTRYQAVLNPAALPVIPITVFHTQDKSRIQLKNAERQPKVIRPALVEFNVDTINTDSDGYNSWSVNIRDSILYHVSCSVTDADEVPAMVLTGEITAAPETVTGSPAPMDSDTTFLEFQGRALKENGRPLSKNSSVMVLLVKDSAILMSRVLPLDQAGRFSLDHLFFFGKADILFQLNNASGNARNVRLELDPYQSPAFHIPEEWVNNDTLKAQEKLFKKLNTERINAHGIVLKEVKIKGWVSPRKELDHIYTSGAFSEPALYSFDLRTQKNYNDLGSYLRMHIPGFQGGMSMSDTPSIPGGHPLLFYVDEQLTTWDELAYYPIADVAYIKALESSFIGNDPYTKFMTGVGGFSLSGGGGGLKAPSQPTSMIVSIYTRKGKDIKLLPGLNTVTISGYSPIAKFNGADENRQILVWEPLEDANSFRLRFTNNNGTKHFRVTIKGFNEAGKELDYTMILPKDN